GRQASRVPCDSPADQARTGREGHGDATPVTSRAFLDVLIEKLPNSWVTSPRMATGVTTGRRRELVAQVAAPVRRFLATEAGSAGVMLAAALLALAWANSPVAGAYESLW